MEAHDAYLAEQVRFEDVDSVGGVPMQVEALALEIEEAERDADFAAACEFAESVRDFELRYDR